MSKPKKRYCCLCKGELPRGELGFNPEPVASYTSGTCCVKCHRDKVLLARVKSKTTTNPPMPSTGPLEGDWVVHHDNAIVPPKMDKVNVKEI